VSYDNERSRQDSGASNSSNGSANNQSYRIRRHAADQAAQLEQGIGGEVRPLNAEEGEDSPIERLKGARCQEICTSIPTNIGVRLELASNVGDCL
jgi:hypothetical protein